MNNQKIKYIWMFALIYVLFSCAKTEIGPLSSGETPSSVTGITSEALPGASILKFKVPTSDNYLYARVEFEIRPGVVKSIKTSIYERSVLLEGFGQAGSYPIKIYSVGKGEVESAPITVNVSVAEPAYLSAFKTIQVVDDFGGITVIFENTAEKQVGVNVGSYDPNARAYRLDHTYYSKQKEDDFRATGYETKPVQYAITVFDRWGNVSDTLFITKTPLEEFELDKGKFVSHPLPPYNNLAFDSYCVITHLWNKQVGAWYYGYSGYRSASLVTPSVARTHDFSFDVGSPYKLSRFKMFHAHATAQNLFYHFSVGTPQTFELYGSNSPNPDGSWASWELISAYTSKKPEGFTDAQLRQYALVDGEDFMVPSSAGTYRYYRWKTISLFSTNSYVAIDELTFWGGSVN